MIIKNNLKLTTINKYDKLKLNVCFIIFYYKKRYLKVCLYIAF